MIFNVILHYVGSHYIHYGSSTVYVLHVSYDEVQWIKILWATVMHLCNNSAV